MTDIVTLIKKRCDPDNYFLDTAEGRYSWDKDLLAEIKSLQPLGLQHKVRAMLKHWRWKVLDEHDRPPHWTDAEFDRRYGRLDDYTGGYHD